MTTLLDKDAIKQKYAAERAKRLRPEGNGQYQRLSGKFEDMATDPHTPFVPRDPVTDHVTFAFIGAGMSGHLFVFQRTPSSVDVRNNRPIDPEWFAGISRPGWQKRWMDNFVENMSRGIPSEDLVDDGWTQISRRIREKVLNGRPIWAARLVSRVAGALGSSPVSMRPEQVLKAIEDADIEKMAEIRARVDAVVKDRDTADKLKAWYAQLCKRPCFSDEYLDAFNSPSTTLVDTDGKGVDRITETGLVVGGQHYEVDCIVYASGFEFGANFQLKTGFDIRGRGGQLLSDYWGAGLRTLHGLHVPGFPNAFMVQMNQAANMVTNIPHNIVDHALTVAQVVAHAEREGYTEVEPTEEAVSQWVDLILSEQGSLFAAADCTPGFWNNEGQGWSREFRQSQGHPGGADGFFRHIDKWRRSGSYDGLVFRR